jgi:hypothetical protein
VRAEGLPDHAEPIPIFVGGLHRSGTTLLADLLGAHPDVAALRDTGAFHDEGQFLQDVMPTAAECGGPGRFAHGAGAHLTDDDVQHRENERARLLTSWSPYWEPGRHCVIEKSPPNLLRFRYLQALFPNAWCIAVVRHPIAVAFATEGWAAGHSSVDDLLEHWCVAHELFESDRPRVQRLLFLRYEDLVKDVPGTLAHIDDAVGLSRHLPDIEVRRDTNDRYLERWHRGRRVPFHPRIVERIRYGRRIERLGYGYRLS